MIRLPLPTHAHTHTHTHTPGNSRRARPAAIHPGTEHPYRTKRGGVRMKDGPHRYDLGSLRKVGVGPRSESSATSFITNLVVLQCGRGGKKTPGLSDTNHSRTSRLIADTRPANGPHISRFSFLLSVRPGSSFRSLSHSLESATVSLLFITGLVEWQCRRGVFFFFFEAQLEARHNTGREAACEYRWGRGSQRAETISRRGVLTRST